MLLKITNKTYSDCFPRLQPCNRRDGDVWLEDHGTESSQPGSRCLQSVSHITKSALHGSAKEKNQTDMIATTRWLVESLASCCMPAARTMNELSITF